MKELKRELIPATDSMHPEHEHCPKCGAWLKREIAENISAPSYRYCSNPTCNWTERPQWKLGVIAPNS